MTVRTSLARLVRRDPDRPTLRERIEALRSRLARHRQSMSEERRSLLAGVASAAVMPFAGRPARAATLVAPAGLAAAADAITHPDAALFEAERAYVAARTARETAREAHQAAERAARAATGPVPEALIATKWEERHIIGTVPGLTGFGWVRTMPIQRPQTGDGDYVNPDHAWMPQGLQVAIERAPAVLGRAGRTPHRIRRWKALLPIAEAFDERRVRFAAFFRTKELYEARTAAEAAVKAVHARLEVMPATTLDGLAIKVARLAGSSWSSMPLGWAALLEAAAAVTGAPVATSSFDAVDWIARFQAVGGRVSFSRRDGEWRFSQPSLRDADEATRETSHRLLDERDSNRLALYRWLYANREAGA